MASIKSILIERLQRTGADHINELCRTCAGVGAIVTHSDAPNEDGKVPRCTYPERCNRRHDWNDCPGCQGVGLERWEDPTLGLM